MLKWFDRRPTRITTLSPIPRFRASVRRQLSSSQPGGHRKTFLQVLTLPLPAASQNGNIAVALDLGPGPLTWDESQIASFLPTLYFLPSTTTFILHSTFTRPRRPTCLLSFPNRLPLKVRLFSRVLAGQSVSALFTREKAEVAARSARSSIGLCAPPGKKGICR